MNMIDGMLAYRKFVRGWLNCRKAKSLGGEERDGGIK